MIDIITIKTGLDTMLTTNRAEFILFLKDKIKATMLPAITIK
ncbi:hypothetical protein ABER68_25220 [Paenibacillus alvei]